ncbi:MAG TPA: polyprenyl synthetase family protein [Jatrophihabitantaceae bacterium]|nr:polyprenyl synthetase family protein [Jatrophihabitantaceae bacterium]
MDETDAFVKRVDMALSTFLDRRAASLRKVGGDLDPIAAEATEFVMGGKRLRPAFAYWGWRASRAATEDDAALLVAAASLELLHASALVHDDVMDASDTRRGRPAAHSAFAVLHRDQSWTGSPDAFGNAAAILLGDLLLCWADAMFATAAVGGAARQVYDDIRETVMAGQYLDVLVQARGDFSAADALRVARFKTSKYTVEGPLQLGAAAADAPPEILAALSDYGLLLGEAFQLRDDVLGTFGDPHHTGKPAGGDLREGKRTLLVALAMQRASPAEATLLRGSLGDRGLSAAGIARVCELLVSTGALSEVEHRIAGRTDLAQAALDVPGIRTDAREALLRLATTATDRRA